MIILDGKQTSAKIKEEIEAQVSVMKQQNKRTPHLAAVLVGTNGASMTYVGAKVKACQLVGFESTLIELSAETTEAQLLNKIEQLSKSLLIKLNCSFDINLIIGLSYPILFYSILSYPI